MKLSIKFIFATALCISSSGYAQVPDAGIKKPVLSDAASLSLSKEGAYLYAHLNGRLVVARVEDTLNLMPERNEASIPLFNDMGVVQFAESDRYLFTQRSDGSFQRYDLNNTAEGQPLLDDTVQVQGDGLATENFTMYFPQDMRAITDWSESSRKIVNNSLAYKSGDIGFNSRNIYGLIFGEKYIFLSRDNDFNLHVHTRKNKGGVFDTHGHAFYQVDKNLDFRYDFGRYYILASGSVLSSNEAGKIKNISTSDTSAKFISGDLPGRYYGYFTPHSLHPYGVSSGLVKKITGFLQREPDIYVTGLSVNNRTKSFVISYISGLQGTFDYHDAYSSKEAVYTHFVFVNGRTATLKPGKPSQAVSYSTIKLENGLAVDRYIVAPLGKTVFYVHGGPNDSETLADSDTLHYLLSAGFNVDVFNYGGAAYSYDLANAINRKGIGAYAQNASAITAYLKSSYPDKASVYLYMASFGGQFYRFLPKDLLQSLGGVILDEPAGWTDTSQNTQTPPIKAMRRSIYGDAVISGAFDNHYYESLSACQIQSKTLLVYGKKDTNVRPGYDYRFCGDSPFLTTYVFEGKHGESYQYAFDKIVNFIDHGNLDDKK